MKSYNYIYRICIAFYILFFTLIPNVYADQISLPENRKPINKPIYKNNVKVYNINEEQPKPYSQTNNNTQYRPNPNSRPPQYYSANDDYYTQYRPKPSQRPQPYYSENDDYYTQYRPNPNSRPPQYYSANDDYYTQYRPNPNTRTNNNPYPRPNTQYNKNQVKSYSPNIIYSNPYYNIPNQRLRRPRNSNNPNNRYRQPYYQQPNNNYQYQYPAQRSYAKRLKQYQKTPSTENLNKLSKNNKSRNDTEAFEVTH